MTTTERETAIKPRLLLLACAALVLLFASTPDNSYAQTAPSDLAVSPSKTPGMFDTVPADAWPFSAVDTLQKAGIVIGYSNGTYEGNHTLPRREFAVMVVRLMPLSLDAQAKLGKSPGALAALVALINEFRPDIVQIFASVATLGNPLPRVEEQLRLLRSRQSRVFPVTPANVTPPRNLYGIVGRNWPYIAMNTLHDAGFIGFPHDSRVGRIALDRYNFALLVARVLPLLSPSRGGNTGIAIGGAALDLKTDSAKAQRDTIKKLTENPPALNALIVLVDEFAPELKFLGQDVPAAQRRLQTMQTKVRQDSYAGKRTLSVEAAHNLFADVPVQDISYDCIDTLRRANIVIGDQSTFAGKMPLTCLQAATAIAHLVPFPLPRLVAYDGKQQIILNATLPQYLRPKLQQSPLALDALMTLVIEFTPELKLLGQDVELLQDSLADVRQSVAKPTLSQAARASDELPSDSWTYAALNAIKKDGVPFGYQMGDGALKGQTVRPVQSGLTRYEFAVSVARILPLIDAVGTPMPPERPFYLPPVLRKADLPSIDVSRRGLESKLLNNTELLDALRALTNEFRLELLQLHIDAPAVMSRLDTIQDKSVAAGEQRGRRIKFPFAFIDAPDTPARPRPFPDVPPNHWAYSAVEALRQSGIVVGYP